MPMLNWLDLSILTVVVWGGITGFSLGWSVMMKKLAAIMAALLLAWCFFLELRLALTQQFNLEDTIAVFLEKTTVIPAAANVIPQHVIGASPQSGSLAGLTVQILNLTAFLVSFYVFYMGLLFVVLPKGREDSLVHGGARVGGFLSGLLVSSIICVLTAGPLYLLLSLFPGLNTLLQPSEGIFFEKAVAMFYQIGGRWY